MMNPYQRKIESEQLEAMIDRSSLKDVLEMLAEICGEKAEHIRSNWQDEPMARFWEADARKVARVAEKVR